MFMPIHNNSFFSKLMLGWKDLLLNVSMWMVFLGLKKITKFYFWLHWVFIAVLRLSLVVMTGGYSLLWAKDSYCSVFSSFST